MKKVYVAGKLNDNAVGYIQNMHKMINNAYDIRKMGFSVYIPCLDFLYGLVAGDADYRDYFDNNIAWMKCADAVFVGKGWETSKGTKREIQIAQHNNIPVFYYLTDLRDWGKDEC